MGWDVGGKTNYMDSCFSNVSEFIVNMINTISMYLNFIQYLMRYRCLALYLSSSLHQKYVTILKYIHLKACSYTFPVTVCSWAKFETQTVMKQYYRLIQYHVIHKHISIYTKYIIIVIKNKGRHWHWSVHTPHVWIHWKLILLYMETTRLRIVHLTACTLL